MDQDTSTTTNLQTYIAVLVIFASSSAVCWIYWYGIPLSLNYVIGALVFAVLIALTHLVSIKLRALDLGDKKYGGQLDFAPLELTDLLALVILGPIWAAVATLPGTLYGLGRDEPLRHIYELSSAMCRIFFAAIPFYLFAEPVLANPSQAPSVLVVATACAGLVFVIANFFTDGILLRVKYGRPLIAHTQNYTPYLPLEAVNVAVIALAMAFFAMHPPVAVVLVITAFVVNLLVARKMSALVSERHDLKTRQRYLQREALQSNKALALQLVIQLGKDDQFSDRHAAATGTYAADIMAELGYDEDHVECVRIAGFLHNIGLFESSHKINGWEDDELPTHPLLGEQILRVAPGMQEISRWVAEHHERPDRCGYPKALPDAWILFEAKVLCVADTYARMILDKPHQAGEAPEIALRQLRKGMQSHQLDPKAGHALIRLLETSPAEYTHALTEDFQLPNLFAAHDHDRQQYPDNTKPSTQPTVHPNPSADLDDPLVP